MNRAWCQGPPDHASVTPRTQDGRPRRSTATARPTAGTDVGDRGRPRIRGPMWRDRRTQRSQSTSPTSPRSSRPASPPPNRRSRGSIWARTRDICRRRGDPRWRTRRPRGALGLAVHDPRTGPGVQDRPRGGAQESRVGRRLDGGVRVVARGPSGELVVLGRAPGGESRRGAAAGRRPWIGTRPGSGQPTPSGPFRRPGLTLVHTDFTVHFGRSRGSQGCLTGPVAVRHQGRSRPLKPLLAPTGPPAPHIDRQRTLQEHERNCAKSCISAHHQTALTAPRILVTAPKRHRADRAQHDISPFTEPASCPTGGPECTSDRANPAASFSSPP
jgi:hypothetical protein